MPVIKWENITWMAGFLTSDTVELKYATLSPISIQYTWKMPNVMSRFKDKIKRVSFVLGEIHVRLSEYIQMPPLHWRPILWQNGNLKMVVRKNPDYVCFEIIKTRPWILHRQSVQYRRGYCTDSRFINARLLHRQPFRNALLLSSVPTVDSVRLCA